jgi:tetratricopeptide (TPR) repeat protein
LKGGEKYQQAFYVFEELAQAPSTSSMQSLICQAVAEIHLGRLEEAEAALQQALSKEPKNAEVISNSIVLNAIQGKDVSQLESFVSSTICDWNFTDSWYAVTCKAPHPTTISSQIFKKRQHYSTKQQRSTLRKLQHNTQR